MTVEKAQSSASSYSITLIACLLVVRVLTVVRSYVGRYRLRLPPGPRRILLLGNIHQLPPVYQQHLFAEWGKQFGDLVYARFFRTPVLILNRIQTARALLEKRGAKYSSRPSFTYQRDIVHFDHVILMPYSDRWRRHRRWFQNALLTRNTLNTYEPMQRREMQMMLRDILHDSEGALAHVRRYTAAVMLGVGYGYSPTSLDDEYIKMTEEAIELALGGSGPSSGLVDFFPELQYLPAWMPGMGFKRKGLRARKMTHDMDHFPLQRLQREMEEGTSRPCLGTVLLEDAMNKGVLDETEEHEIAGALGVLYVAGTDTTAATLTAFVLLMALHQDIQKKIQTEIDSVVGDLRLPAYSDRTSLPYFEAVMKEVYRWLAPAPLGTPHQVTESDVYEGFDIEKGATVITNIWAMTREEELFEDPEQFDPERFLGASAEISEARDPRRFVFGFGRRICPGRLIADSSVFLAAANLVAAFDIRPGEGLDPQQAVAQSSFTSGVVRHPKPFPCYVTPRSPKKADLVLNAVDASGDEA